VYLPPGYAQTSDRRYPILVLHDGQNLFDPDRAYVKGAAWQVAQTADRVIAAGRVEPLVIVGVDHAGPTRIDEYTPTPGNRRGAGQAARHAAFLVDELLPFIGRTYAVATAAEQVGLGGSSLGGLATLFVAATYPARFGRLLVMSPSVWWDRRAILPIVRKRLAPAAVEGLRIWLDVGIKEGARPVADARRLCDILAHHAPGTLRYVEDPDGDHSERSWGRRFGDALEFLFGVPAAVGGETRTAVPVTSTRRPAL